MTRTHSSSRYPGRESNPQSSYERRILSPLTLPFCPPGCSDRIGPERQPHTCAMASGPEVSGRPRASLGAAPGHRQTAIPAARSGPQNADPRARVCARGLSTRTPLDTNSPAASTRIPGGAPNSFLSTCLAARLHCDTPSSCRPGATAAWTPSPSRHARPDLRRRGGARRTIYRRSAGFMRLADDL